MLTVIAPDTDPGLHARDEPERPGAERAAARAAVPAPVRRAAHQVRRQLNG